MASACVESEEDWELLAASRASISSCVEGSDVASLNSAPSSLPAARLSAWGRKRVFSVPGTSDSPSSSVVSPSQSKCMGWRPRGMWAGLDPRLKVGGAKVL